MPFNGFISKRKTRTYQDIHGSGKQVLVRRGMGAQAKLTHSLLTDVLNAHKRGMSASDLSTMFDLKADTIEAIIQDV